MTYLSRPVLDVEAAWSEPPTLSAELDPRVQKIGHGEDVTEVLASYARSTRELNFEPRTEQQIADLEAFIADIQSTGRGWWIPDPGEFLSIVAGVSTTAFRIEAMDLTNWFGALPPGTSVGSVGLHLYAQLNGGAAEIRRVTSVSTVSAEVEQVTLASAATAWTPAWRVRRLLYVRLAEDQVEWEYVNESRARVSLRVYEVPLEYAAQEVGSAPAWLYTIIRSRGGSTITTWRWTSYDQALTVGSDTFSPAPIGHEELVEGVAMDRSPLKLLGWVEDSSPWRAWIPFAPADVFRLTLERVNLAAVDVGASRGFAFVGQIDKVSLKGKAVSAECVSYLDMLSDRKLPRFYKQKRCNHTFGEPNSCRKTIVPIDAEVLNTGSRGWEIVVTDGALNSLADGWFAFGLITFTPSGGLPERIQIVDSENLGGGDQRIKLLVPPAALPAIGSTVSLTVGCDLARDTCETKHGNLVNFGGHPFMDEPLGIVAVKINNPSGGKGGK